MIKIERILERINAVLPGPGEEPIGIDELAERLGGGNHDSPGHRRRRLQGWIYRFSSEGLITVGVRYENGIARSYFSRVDSQLPPDKPMPALEPPIDPIAGSHNRPPSKTMPIIHVGDPFRRIYPSS